MSRIIRITSSTMGLPLNQKPDIPLYTDPRFTATYNVINHIHDTSLVYFVGFYEDAPLIYLKVIYQDQAGWIWLGHVATIHELDELPDGTFTETLVYPND